MLMIKNLCKSYGKHLVLDHLNLVLPSNGLVALLGQSGSGKTTLFNMLGLLDTLDQGSILFNGVDISKFNDEQKAAYRKRYCGILFQKYHLIDYYTIEDNVLLPLEIKGKEVDIREYLSMVNLLHKLKEYPYTLSGGEQQRIALARILSSNYPIILADEPTGALDSKNAHLIMSILKEESKNSLVVMVTHNEELAFQYANNIIRLNNGKIVENNIKIDNNKNRVFYKEDKNKIKSKYLVKWTKNVLLHNKNRYIASMSCYCLCLTAFICVLGLKNGLTIYANSLINNRLDYSYIDIYSIKDGYMSSLDESIDMVLEQYNEQIERQISYDDLLSSLYIDGYEKDIYYEIKVIDNIDKAYYNDLFEKQLNDKLVVAGTLIVPYTSNKNAEYIDVSWDFNAEYVYEGKTYNTAKLYLPRDKVIEYLKETNLPLLNEQLNEVNNVYSYVAKYINKEIYMPTEIVIKNNIDKEKIYNSLLEMNNCYPKYNTENLKETYNLIVTGDEMIRNTFMDLLDAGGTAILLFILTLIMSVISLITLILYYSMKKRSKEFSVIRSFGGSSKDIARLIIFEAGVFSLITYFISITLSFLIRIVLYNISVSIFDSPYKIDLIKMQFYHILLGFLLLGVVLLFSTISPILLSKKQNIVSVIQDD